MRQKDRNRSFLIILFSFLIPFLIFFAFLFLLYARASADKFQSSFSNDYTTQTKQQDLKIPSVQTQKVSTTITSSIPQQTTASNTDWALQANKAQAIAPSLSITPAPDMSSLAVSAPMPYLAAPTTPALTKTRITTPDFEEKYKKLFEAQAKTKHKKKKSLIDSILDEAIHYGLFIVLGLVILVVIYTLQKDKETLKTISRTPQHPGQLTKGEEPKKNIWQDDF